MIKYILFLYKKYIFLLKLFIKLINLNYFFKFKKSYVFIKRRKHIYDQGS